MTRGRTKPFKGVLEMHLMSEELARAHLSARHERVRGEPLGLGAERLRLVAARRRQRRADALRRVRVALGR
jgi:hypothetical protein